MKQSISIIWVGVKEAMKHKSSLVLFVAAFFVMLVLFTLIPVWAVIGNTVSIQLDIFTLADYTIIIFLSGLYALFIAMQVYVMRQTKSVKRAGVAVTGGVGAIFAGIAGTAFCASCLAPLFALFGIGFGGVIFVLEYRFYFVVGISVLMLIAVYLTARKIKNICDNC